MLRRPASGALVAIILLVSLMIVGYLADPSLPSSWDRWSPIKYVGLGAAWVLLEALVDGMTAVLRRRRRRPDLLGP